MRNWFKSEQKSFEMSANLSSADTLRHRCIYCTIKHMKASPHVYPVTNFTFWSPMPKRWNTQSNRIYTTPHDSWAKFHPIEMMNLSHGYKRIAYKPADLPFMPNVGPWDGWRIQAIVFSLRWAPSAWHKPTVVVLLPSPSGVGVMLKQNHNSRNTDYSHMLSLSPQLI